MSQITIGGFNYPYAQNGAFPYVSGTVELRIWFTGGPGTQFLDVDGNTIPYGSGTDFFKSVPCTVASNSITIPAFTIPATDNSSNISSVASAQFYVNGSPADFLFSGWIITSTLGTSIAFSALYTYNLAASIPYQLDPLYLQAPDVAALINIAVGTLNDASSTVKGRTKLDTDPIVATNPIAVGSNSLRLTGLENATVGIKVATQIEFDRAGSIFTEEAAPGAPTLAAGAAGNVDIGSHDYVVTFVTANGRTEAGTLANIVIAATTKQVNLTNVPTGSAFVTAREIWRSRALIPISAATNANPVEFTTSVNHGLTTGTTHTIAGATGSWTPVNGAFIITVTAANKFTIAVNSTTFGALTGTVTVDPKSYETDKYYLVGTIPNNTATTFTDNVADINLTPAGGLLANNSTAARVLIGAVPGGWIAQTNTAFGFRAGAFDETRFDANTGEYNTSVGARSGPVNSTGSFNTHIGYESGLANTTGLQNTNAGSQAGSNNATGMNNTMVGQAAGMNNLSSSNTAVGSFAYWNPQNATDNVAVGVNALRGGLLTTASQTVAVGVGAGFSLTTGNNNNFTGWNAGAATTTGGNNVANGFNALNTNNIGTDNTAIGTNALKGVASSANFNTAVGSGAGFSVTSGGSNALVGGNCGSSINTGTQNAGLGLQALNGTTSGGNNVGVGVNAGMTNGTGSNNTCVGASADVGSAALDHATAIGAGAVVSTSNTIALGRAGGNDAVVVPGSLNVTGNATVQGALNYAADGGGTDSYAITLSPAPAAYVAGMHIAFKANTANTGACSINVNGLGAKALKRGVSTDPPDNFIKSGSIVLAIYDGTNFQMIQPAAQ